MKNNLWMSALPLLGLLAQGQPPTGESACQVRLEQQLQGDRLLLTGHCRNGSPQAVTLRYELLTDKRGAAGTAHGAQSGTVTIAPRQAVVLSQTTLNVRVTDFYKVQLQLRDDQGRLVAQDSLVHQPGAPL